MQPSSPSGLRVLAAIPARYASTRFPGKALAQLAGRPLIEHVYRRAAACPGVDRVVVATDDARIVQAVEAFGGEARPPPALFPPPVPRSRAPKPLFTLHAVKARPAARGFARSFSRAPDPPLPGDA